MMNRLLGALVGDAEIEALFSDAAELAALARVEGALAAAETDAGLIAADAAARIAQVCESFVPQLERLAEGLPRDGVAIPDFVAQLRAAVGPEHAAAVHVGATSQDIIDTALVIRLATAIRILERRIEDLARTLDELAATHGDRPLMAHTRMQAALPFTAGDKVQTWRLPLPRHLQRLRELQPRLLVVQLGGPVGNRDSFLGQGEAIAAAMAARLGLATAPAWHSQRDGIGEFAAWLSLVSGTLGKIGEDVALMAQSEVGAVRLAGAGGSSSMAHKANPVPAEVLVALARFNAGLLGTLHQALVHEGERSGAAWTLEWMVLPQMVVATASGLATAQSLCTRLTFGAGTGEA